MIEIPKNAHPNLVRALTLRNDPAFRCVKKDEQVEALGGICPACGESTMAHDPEGVTV